MYPPEFEEIYSLYPRKEKKKVGFEIYSREIHTELNRQALVRAVRSYTKKKKGVEMQYLMHFGSFMAEWRDWYEPETLEVVEDPTPDNSPYPKPFKPWESNWKCGQCFDVGTFLCIHGPNHALYAFRCHCDRGEQDPRTKIPQYKQWHVEQGYELFDPRNIHREGVA